MQSYALCLYLLKILWKKWKYSNHQSLISASTRCERHHVMKNIFHISKCHELPWYEVQVISSVALANDRNPCRKFCNCYYLGVLITCQELQKLYICMQTHTLVCVCVCILCWWILCLGRYMFAFGSCPLNRWYLCDCCDTSLLLPADDSPKENPSTLSRRK